MALCTMRQMVKRYKDLVALDHFDLDIREGEIAGLLGPNGSGKTTAINCLLGLLRFDGGEITLFGSPPSLNDQKMKRRIGLVPGELAYFQELTVAENIAYFAGLYERNSSRQKEMTDFALEFTDLGRYSRFPARKLSTGLKRRLNIACGIVHKPEFLILDEPTIALDAQSRKYVLDGVREMNRRGSTVLYTTHYLDEAQDICDRIIIMDKGRNMASGTLEELINLVDPTERVHIEFGPGASDMKVGELLNGLPGLLGIEEENGRTTVLLTPPGQHLPGLLEVLASHGIPYTTLYSELPTLNDVFLKLTGRALRD